MKIERLHNLFRACGMSINKQISKFEKLKVLKYAILSDSKDLKYPSDYLPVYVELKYQ